MTESTHSGSRENDPISGYQAPPRSVLIVPASVPRFLEKAPSVDADAFVIDLEDSVTPGDKVRARALAASALQELDFGGRSVALRVNGWASAHTFRDVIEVVGRASGCLDAVLLPKTGGPAEVHALDLLLAQVEREAGTAVGRTGIDLLVESARGLAEVERSCRASKRVRSVVLGPGDLASSLGMPVLTTPRDRFSEASEVLRAALFRILVAARAQGLVALDGPFFGLEDDEGLRASALRARALGCDGKWAIHPDQVAVLNEVFSPTSVELERAREILARLGEAEASGQGAVRDGNEMIDEASRQMAHAVLGRSRRTRAVSEEA